MLYLARHPLAAIGRRLVGGLGSSAACRRHRSFWATIISSGDRAARAAELFQAGWAPQVVASGRMLRPYAGVAELIARDLEGRGVPAAAIVNFAQHADSTRSEAQALRELVAQRHWHRILVVTSNYHTRRARYIFRKVFPSDVSVSVSSAPDSEYDPDSWWETASGLKTFLYRKCGLLLRNVGVTEGPAAGQPSAVVWATCRDGALGCQRP